MNNNTLSMALAKSVIVIMMTLSMIVVGIWFTSVSYASTIDGPFEGRAALTNWYKFHQDHTSDDEGILTFSVFLNNDTDEIFPSTIYANITTNNVDSMVQEYVWDGYHHEEDVKVTFTFDDVFVTNGQNYTFNIWDDNSSMDDHVVRLTEDVVSGWFWSDLCYSGYGDTFDMVAVNDVITASAPVPEPATIFLFGIGLLGISGLARRRN